ncbi:hypothetical protein EDD18DRAFT_1166896 [Armillaria luteobubalina]|uniref:Uncharacterized protein n=1 Tax=Armillaria luteobubalina TaxID=153913 RepID=A0AA39Q5R6_9AGAR|nr:hypothetical protein EDD18DRAFT_1166896 [Armillaria luteobubalina]
MLILLIRVSCTHAVVQLISTFTPVAEACKKKSRGGGYSEHDHHELRGTDEHHGFLATEIHPQFTTMLYSHLHIYQSPTETLSNTGLSPF